MESSLPKIVGLKCDKISNDFIYARVEDDWPTNLKKVIEYTIENYFKEDDNNKKYFLHEISLLNKDRYKLYVIGLHF